MNKVMLIKFHAQRNYCEKLIKTHSSDSFETWLMIKEKVDLKHLDKKVNFSSVFVNDEMINAKSETFLVEFM